jgi:hypothetical protein
MVTGIIWAHPMTEQEAANSVSARLLDDLPDGAVQFLIDSRYGVKPHRGRQL